MTEKRHKKSQIGEGIKIFFSTLGLSGKLTVFSPNIFHDKNIMLKNSQICRINIEVSELIELNQLFMPSPGQKTQKRLNPSLKIDCMIVQNRGVQMPFLQ